MSIIGKLSAAIVATTTFLFTWLHPAPGQDRAWAVEPAADQAPDQSTNCPAGAGLPRAPATPIQLPASAEPAVDTNDPVALLNEAFRAA